MATYNFRIRKLNDRQWVEKLGEIVAKCGFEKINYTVPIANHSISDSRDQKWSADPVLAQATALDSFLISGVNLWVGQGVHVTLNRDDKNALSDAAAVNVPDNLRNAADFILPVVKSVREILQEVTPPIWNLDALGGDMKAHYEAREVYLARQEREISTFFTKMADFSRELTQQHRAKMDQLESDFAERQKKLDAQHQDRMEELNKRDAEFEKKKAEFDLQEARGMRRKLREDQKKELQELVKKFALTPETEQKRTPIWYAAVLTILMLAGISLYLLFGVEAFDKDGHFNYVVAIRQTTFSLATIGFVWFFIVWSNRWFQRHADEELRLKRLSLDLDRASWVFEMILDWQKETKQEFPLELLKQLAKNLYSVDGVGNDDITKADLLASLLGSAASLKLKGAGGEVEFDRKGLREVETKA